MTDFERLDMLKVIFLNFTFNFHTFSKLETCSFPIKTYSFRFAVWFSIMSFLFRIFYKFSKFLQILITFITDTFRIIFQVLYTFQEFLLLKIVVLKLLTGIFDLCYFFNLYHLIVFFVHMLLKEIGNVKLEENSFQLNFKVV